MFNLHLFCVISVSISGNNASIKDLIALRILMNFWCIYLGKERGGAVMHVYVWEHIVSLYYRTTWWMFTKLDRDEVLMTLHIVKMFRPYPPWGGSRVRQKLVKGAGGPSFKKTSSSDWKATATNRMHNNDLEACEMKCCSFLVPFRSQIFDTLI